MNACPLCNSADIKLVEKVNVIQLINAYKKSLKLDTSKLLVEKHIQLFKCNKCDLLFYNPAVTGDASFYNDLQKCEWYYRTEKEEYANAARYISPFSDVLDVGCGKGEFRNFIMQSNFTGLELSDDAIRIGESKGIKILNETIEKHAAKYQEHYDCVTAFQVLEHVSEIRNFLLACAACVKPGGRLIIAVPSEMSYLKFASNAILNMPPHHVSRWTDDALRQIGNLINFRLIDIIHDRLDPLHRESFYSHMIASLLTFGRQNFHPLLNNTIGHRFRMIVAFKIAKVVTRILSDPAWDGMGQNVTVVFEKPGNP